MKNNLAVDVSAENVTTLATATPVAADIDLVGHVEVSLSAHVGTVTLPLSRLFALKSGDVVAMNELLDEPLTLMLNGRAIATAELVAVDDHFGVRIVEIA